MNYYNCKTNLQNVEKEILKELKIIFRNSISHMRQQNEECEGEGNEENREHGQDLEKRLQDL